jgi:hypothetical protein
MFGYLGARGLGRLGGRGGSGVAVPRIFLSATSIAEDAADNSVVGVLSVVNGSGSYTFSITADADNKFAIANDDELQIDELLDYETATSHLVTIEADNGVDDPITRQFTITVTDVLGEMDAPTLDLVAGSDLGSSSSDDITSDNTPDILITFGTTLVEGDIITFQHDDNNTFTSPTEVEHEVTAGDVIAGTITLTTGTLASPTSYLRAMHSRDADDSAWSNTLTLTIDVTAPTVTSGTTASVDEDATLSHSLTANETVTWSITGGADAADFEISGSTLRWASNGVQDYEDPQDADTDNDYVVQVTATDTAGNTTNQTITVTVDDVAEGFDPLTLTPFMMFDADPANLFESNAGSTAVSGTDPVGYWTDLSGTGFHLNSAADDTTRPIYTLDGSIHVVKFDGTNDALKRLADPGLYNAGAFTISVALKPNGGGTLGTTDVLVAEMGLSSSGTIGHPVRTDSATASTGSVFYRDHGSVNLLQNTMGANIWSNSYKVVTFMWNGTTVTAYVNGVSVGSRSLASGATFNSDRFSLGASWRSDGYNNWFDGWVSHVFIKKAVLSGGDLASLVTYQGAKVGLTI